jgi:hypothetical protein
MASFHFYLELIPTRWLRDNDIEFLFNKEDKLDTFEAWELNQPKIEFEPIISKMLPRGPSWCSDIKIWGDVKESEIQVIREGSKVESISIRLDMRRDVHPLLVEVLDFATELKCHLLIPEYKKCVSASISKIKPIIRESASFEFCAHPSEYEECAV